MPTEKQIDAVYATACMAVLVFIAFFGAYAGMQVQERTSGLRSIEDRAQKETREAKMRRHVDNRKVNDAAKREIEAEFTDHQYEDSKDISTTNATSQGDKIQILMHEYDSLRNEIVQRWIGMQQQISVGVVVLLGIVTVLSSNQIQHPRDYILYSLLGLAICVFCYAMWQVARDSGKAAERVREIEHEVNQRAGAELLQWENRWGGGAAGYWGWARPLRKSATDRNAN